METNAMKLSENQQTTNVNVLDQDKAKRVKALASKIQTELEDGKAENIFSIDIAGRSALADYMIIADGTSGRHLAALSDRLVQLLKAVGSKGIKTEGLGSGDWVLIDEGDIIVHLFRPEVRNFYRLEKMWTAENDAELSEES